MPENIPQNRQELVEAFADGKVPRGSAFRSFIESALSRQDDGLNKEADSGLKVWAGADANQEAISLYVPQGESPDWVMSLMAGERHGLNFAHPNLAAPVLFLDRTTGFLGIGTQMPYWNLDLQDSRNGAVVAKVSNHSNEGSAYAGLFLGNDIAGNGAIFKNSSTNLNDGGPNAMSIRNDAGDLRLLGKGSQAFIRLKADAARVGIMVDNPEAELHLEGNFKLGDQNRIHWSWPGRAIFEQNYGSGSGQDFGTTISFANSMDASNPLGGFNFTDHLGSSQLRIRDFKVGIGTENPAAKLMVATEDSNGDVGSWGKGQVVAGKAAASGPSSGGIGLSYSAAENAGYISSLSPSTAWRNLGIRSNETIFYNGGNELMRLKSDGKLGLGTASPGEKLEVLGNFAGGLGMNLRNSSTASSAYTILRIMSDSSSLYGVLARKSSTNNSDAGAGSLMLRNHGGAIMLEALEGAVHTAGAKMVLKAGSNRVGINTWEPNATLDLTGGAFALNANLNLDSLRPSMSVAKIAGEIAGYSGNGFAGDDGFLRMSAGGGTAWQSKTFIDLSGASNVEEMNKNLRFGTSGLERMRIDAQGKLGLGTKTPNGKLHVITSDSNGEPFAWDGGQMVVGQDGNNGGIGLSYSLSNNTGNISALSPGIAWRNLALKALQLQFFVSGGSEAMRLTSEGKLGLGTSTPAGLFEASHNANGDATMILRNANAGSNAYSQLFFANDTNQVGVIFKNSSTRADDGGTNTLTMRNDGGDLRLLSQGNASGIYLKGGVRKVGINVENPESELHIDGNVKLEEGNRIFWSWPDRCIREEEVGLAGNPDHGIRMVFSNSMNSSNPMGGFDFRDHAGNSALRIQAMNVGIGTSSPMAALHVASTGKAINGKGLLLGKLNDMIKTSSINNELLGQIDLAFAGWRDNEPNQVGAKISALRYAAFSQPNTHLVQATELGFYTGGVSSGPYNVNLHETCSERMRIDRNGKVGIGTGTPFAKLHVNTNDSDGNVFTWSEKEFVVGKEGNAGGLGISYSAQLNTGFISSLSPNISWRDLGFRANNTIFHVAGTEKMRLSSIGHLGIGTNGPICPLDVRGVVPYSNANGYGYLAAGGPGSSPTGLNTSQLSIHAEGRVVAAEFDAVSDQRIKEQVELSDAKADAAMLAQLQVVDYSYIDKTRYSKERQKGFIAQEVKAVFPAAVSMSSEFLPDVMTEVQALEQIEGRLKMRMESAHGFSEGEVLRFIYEGGQRELEISVEGEHEFSVEAWDQVPEKIFVYGRKVNDFHSIDYNKLLALSINTIQGLMQQIETLSARVASLESNN